MPDPTGIPALDQVLLWGGAITVLIGIATGIWRAVRALTRLVKGVEDYLTDWYGEPERPGVPARPGVLERLQRAEASMADIGGRLAGLEHEMRPNSGTSLRDQVDLVNDQLSRLVPEQRPPRPDTPPAE